MGDSRVEAAQCEMYSLACTLSPLMLKTNGYRKMTNTNSGAMYSASINGNREQIGKL